MIQFDSLETFKTYAGCYEGRPSVDSMLETIKRRAAKHWGARPTHVVAAKQDGGRLPTWCHMCLFLSHSPVKDPTLDGSELLIIWFTDSWSCNPDEVVAQVDWNQLAKDFGF